MSNYKYPFIPKEYYAAVMYACKLLRWGKGRNQAVAIAARAYDVDEEGLSKHLAARSGAGQKGKRKAAPEYYIVIRKTDADNPDFQGVRTPEVVTKTEKDKLLDWSQDTGYSYSSYSEVAGPYSSREEASKDLAGWIRIVNESKILGFYEYQRKMAGYFKGR